MDHNHEWKREKRRLKTERNKIAVAVLHRLVSKLIYYTYMIVDLFVRGRTGERTGDVRLL